MRKTGFSLLFLFVFCFFFSFISADNAEQKESPDFGDILGISEEIRKEIMEHLFNLIDSGDRQLTKDELKKFIDTYIKKPEVKRHFELLDKDKNGELSVSELQGIHEDTQGESSHIMEENLKKRFEVVDADGNGVLNQDEFSSLINIENNQELIKLEVDFVLNSQDKDGDGNINLKEFLNQDQEYGENGEELKVEFDSYDLDGNGLISSKEIEAAIKTANAADSSIDGLFTEKESVSLSEWINDAKYALSAVTDHGNLLKYPKDYGINILTNKNEETFNDEL